MKWKHTMHNYFKIFGLWVYIIEKHKQPKKDNTSLEKWVKAHNLTYIALCVCIKRNAYSDIKNITNSKIAWIIFKTNFKSRGSGYLNNTFWKLDSLTFSFYKNPSDYVSKFWIIVNKLQSFSIKIKLDENWLTYWFHINLGNKYSGYF